MRHLKVELEVGLGNAVEQTRENRHVSSVVMNVMIMTPQCAECGKIKLNKVLSDDKDVKDRILGKYGFVDQDEDKRYHRPNLKKNVSLNV